MAIKMIGLDMDGTLLLPDHSISKRNLRALNAAVAAGCVVLPATGRPLDSLPPALSQVSGMEYAVTANGATMFRGKQILETLWMTPEDYTLAYNTAAPFCEAMDLFVAGRVFMRESDMQTVNKWAPPGMEAYLRARCNFVPDLLAHAAKQTGVEKANIFFSDMQKRAAAKAALEATGRFAVTSSAFTNIELNAKDVHKGKGMLALAKQLGIRPDEIMACGDADNDLEMLKAVGLGVAMGNAADAIKQVANVVTDTNQNDGVAKAIEQYVLAPLGIVFSDEA